MKRSNKTFSTYIKKALVPHWSSLEMWQACEIERAIKRAYMAGRKHAKAKTE